MIKKRENENHAFRENVIDTIKRKKKNVKIKFVKYV